MPRVKKDNVPISVRLDKKVFEDLQNYCEQSGVSKTIAIERALNRYIEEYRNDMKTLENIRK